jgi:hypothetical protein
MADVPCRVNPHMTVPSGLHRCSLFRDEDQWIGADSQSQDPCGAPVSHGSKEYRERSPSGIHGANLKHIPACLYVAFLGALGEWPLAENFLAVVDEFQLKTTYGSDPLPRSKLQGACLGSGRPLPTRSA